MFVDHLPIFVRKWKCVFSHFISLSISTLQRKKGKCEKNGFRLYTLGVNIFFHHGLGYVSFRSHKSHNLTPSTKFFMFFHFFSFSKIFTTISLFKILKLSCTLSILWVTIVIFCEIFVRF